MKSLGAAVLAALALPGAAQAAASIVARDVPLHGGERSPAAGATPFELVGLHWRGSGTVLFRTRSTAGRWSRWQAAEDQPDGPDTGSSEERRGRGWHVGEPVWVGPANGIDYRPRGRITKLRASLVTSVGADVPLRRVSVAGSPPIISRLGWSANERIRRAPPAYADSVRLAIVHHTVSANSYSR